MERKLATVLFVDLVDSTGLVTGADPEVVRRRVQNYFERVSRCVTAHGGIVEKFAGDAVVAVFGVPTAHEDDAERAVRAATAILETLGQGLAVRIGIEAGEVVAESGDPEVDFVGHVGGDDFVIVVAPDRAEPCVRHQLVRAGEDADRVELDGAEPPRREQRRARRRPSTPRG